MPEHTTVVAHWVPHLFLERLDTSGLPLLLVDGLHQHTLILELVTLASQVTADPKTKHKRCQQTQKKKKLATMNHKDTLRSHFINHHECFVITLQVRNKAAKAIVTR